MHPLRWFMALLTVLWGAGAAILLTATWCMAYLHGGQITISVSSFGEMWLELWAITIIAPIFAVGLYYILEDLYESRV